MASSQSTKVEKRAQARKAKGNAHTPRISTHRKSSASRRTNNPTLMDDLYNDRRQAAEEARLAREVEAYNFRVRQADMARSSAAITALTEGSIAHKVALLVIEEFPLAEPYVKEDGVQVNRTAAAIETAFGRLSDNEALREKAVKFGVSAARNALRGAYDKAKEG